MRDPAHPQVARAEDSHEVVRGCPAPASAAGVPSPRRAGRTSVSRTEAERARESYLRITESSVVSVVEDAGLPPPARAAPAEASAATCRPGSAPPRR